MISIRKLVCAANVHPSSLSVFLFVCTYESRVLGPLLTVGCILVV